MTSEQKTLYLDCFGGLSGDMFTAALLDLGVPLARLKRILDGLPLRGYRVRSAPCTRAGLAARRFVVETQPEHTHRGLREITRILKRATIPDPVRRQALEVVRRLVNAEARVHRIPAQRVHLHEVGAVDAIVDIVAGCACLYLLGPERVECSELPLGGGSVPSAHGILPVPAPATLELLRGVPVRSGPVEAELVTPTGAALVTTVASRFGPAPPMRVERVGTGAGSRDLGAFPNVMRAWWGHSDAAAGAHASGRTQLSVLEATLDDLNPQIYGYLMERLFEAGALDVHYTPVHMKKNRPGIVISVLARPRHAGGLEEVLFEETSTLGVRSWTAARRELARRIHSVRTPFGRIPVKLAGSGEHILHAAPEYEACARAARRHHVPLKRVQQAALEALPARPRRSRK
ncbi:MAG: nickel pincer cofactor biosynthesis protein LarC [Acidobacteriota bacterium]